jgi:hypothetical protein
MGGKGMIKVIAKMTFKEGAVELVKEGAAEFAAETRKKLENHPALNSELLSKLKEGEYKETIHRLVNDEHSEPMYYDNVLVGCVKRAHDIDKNLEAGIMLENLAAKATNVLAILNLLNKCNIDKEDIEYVIDCCEEACGDMNQRGGGNFAKACAETAGLTNATGSDVRGFCAGPAHALIMAASLVKAGTFRNVIVSAGGSTAKLGLNGKGQVKKGMPVLEDTLGGFAILVSENDGINPEVRVDLVGRHTVGTGSSPQAVITSLVSESLDKVGMKITDIDRYSVEMQNPDITKSAGAGDVPLANYKMIGSLAVKRGDIEKNEIIEFAESHGMVGWAPTQGHIPSGVPYIGFARQQILNGEIMNAMIIGKGSLFIGRMTNIFDGMSVIMEANKGIQEVEGIISEEKIKELIAQAMKNFASSLLEE